MNQNTLLTVVVVGGLAAVAYMVYKNNQKTNPTVVQVTTPGNTGGSGNGTADIINAGSDALSKITDIFGA